MTVACASVACVSVAPVAVATSAASAAPERGRVVERDEDRFAAYDEALVSLTQELSYLVLLGWVVTPLPAEARDMPAAIGIERMRPAEMVDAIRYLDDQRGPAALERLRALGEPVSPAVERVLAANVPLPTDVAPDVVPRVGTGVYLDAYGDLLDVWSMLQATADPAASIPPIASPSVASPTVAGPSVASPSVANSSDVSPSASTDGGAGGTTSVAVAVIAAVLLAALAAGAVVAGRRRRRSTAAVAATSATPTARAAPPALTVAHDDVLDAGRRIMGASDTDAFGHAVAQQVARLTGADGAVVVDDRVWNPAARAMPDATTIDRVLSTGRQVRTDAYVSAPVVADGRVLGALVAWSATPEHAEVLGAFSALVGAALQGLRARVEHEHLAFDDALTGVGNRRRFDRDLERLVGPSSGRGLPVGLAMVDVDHFKRVNDAHGHPVGDAVLRHVAEVVSAHVREGDLVYRYGGEEFAVLLPGAASAEVQAVVERVRAAVAASPFRLGDGALLSVTVSVGVSSTPPVDATAMVRTADGALYAAKSNGRNRVEVGASS